MTTQQDTQPQPAPAWSENRIVDAIQAQSTDQPRIDVYHQIEWVTDDVAIALAMEVYTDMCAELDALRAQLAEATAATWQPLPDGDYTMQGWSDTYTLHVCFDGAELEAWSNAAEDKYKDGSPRQVEEMGVGDYRLCRLQPGNPLGKGGDDATDWSTAPDWATYWTRDVSGVTMWWETKPFYDGRIGAWMCEDESRRVRGTDLAVLRRRATAISAAQGQAGEVMP